MHRRTWVAMAALPPPLCSPPCQAQAKDIKIAIIASKTGPLEAYAKQTIVGFNMGLNYATGGTMTVATARSWW
jgi:branched-chain amino acid transport system substrate-binding protein